MWSSMIMTWFVGTFFLKHEVTFLPWSQNDNSGGAIILLGVLITIVLTTTIWSLNTITVRAEEYVEQFEKEIEAERIKALHAAKLTSLGNMAAGIAHEINNPLAIIVGKVVNTQKNLSHTVIDIPRVQDSMKSILQQSDRISKIIKSLKSMTADGSREQIQLCSLVEIILQTKSFIENKFESTHTRFIFDEKNDFSVNCRPTEISQIFYNLFANALDAIQTIENKWIRIEIQKNQKYTEITFADSGGPLSSDTIAHLFEPFFTTKEVGEGTGLGLSVSYAMAKRNQADFFYDESAPTTTFRLRFLNQS